MSHLNLVVQWLLYGRGRSVLTMLSVAAAFVLFGLLQGMNQGVDVYNRSLSAGVQIVSGRAGAFLPESYLERIRNVRGVEAVADLSFFGGYFRERRNALPVYATDVKAFFAVYPELSIPHGALQAMEDMRVGAIVSRPVAAQFGWKVGDTVPIGSFVWQNRDGSSTWPITIAGIYELAATSSLPNMLLINYAYFDAGRTWMNGNTNDYLVRVDGARPPREIQSDIDSLFANSGSETRTQSEREYMQAQIQQATDIRLVADTITAAVIFMLLFVTGNTMMQSFRERTGQLAVLRTIGFSPRRIVVLVISEAMLLCVFAAVLGLAIARMLFPIGRATAFDPHSTLAAINMPPITVLSGVGIAAVLALASALPAAWRAGRLNVIDALSER
jgi:putative ABC transport system permease protein